MPRCQIYTDVKGQWRWRCVDKKSGDIKSHSDRGFDTREECEKNGKEEGNCTSFLHKVT